MSEPQQPRRLPKITHYTTEISFFFFLRILEDWDIGYGVMHQQSVFTYICRRTVRREQLILMCWSQVDRIDGDRGCFCRVLVWLSCVTDTCSTKAFLMAPSCKSEPAGSNKAALNVAMLVLSFPFLLACGSGMLAEKQNVQMLWERRRRQRYCKRWNNLRHIWNFVCTYPEYFRIFFKKQRAKWTKNVVLSRAGCTVSTLLSLLFCH